MDQARATLKPLVGWGLGGATHRPWPAGVTVRLGEPAWGPHELLRDLELRLGLPQGDAPATTRVQAWTQRIEGCLARASEEDGDRAPFYARSFEADRIGTAATLLGWRDALVEAGWTGQPARSGGDRLDALAALEASSDEELPRGRADRLVVVEHELRTCSKHVVYDEVALVEDRALWPSRWRSIFDLLEERGARIVAFVPDLPLAPETSDLGVLQRMLRGPRASRSGHGPPAAAVSGDGSLSLVRGDTPGELAELTAAYLAKTHAATGDVDRTLVVRCADPAPLEAALARHGVPQQGTSGSTPWRPAMQILPLAFELAFGPRDPHRVLELLTLPVGPFQGLLGKQLARALAKQPGVGGAEWAAQKAAAASLLRAREVAYGAREGLSTTEAEARADAFVEARMERVAAWLEAPCLDAGAAPRDALLAVARRVSTWLTARLATSDEDATALTFGAAIAQARAMVEALSRDTRAALSREDVRQLVDTFARGAAPIELTTERAGRLSHVAHPAAVLGAADTVVFWGFVSGAERRPATPPWNEREKAALAGAGVVFPEAATLLAVEADAWRRGILAARERVVLVVPASVKGEPTAPHPLWDEITARFGLEDAVLASRITRHVRELLGDDGRGVVPTTALRPLALPEARGAWRLPAGSIAADGGMSTSPTALDTLATCPLRFVLEHTARIRGGAIAKVADGPLLNGNLGHRLVEELHQEGAFALDEAAFEARASIVLAHLVATEAATLLLPGGAFERAQLTAQLVRAMRGLHRFLVGSGWRIEAVEEVVETTSSIGTLFGRLDVRLVDREGRHAVLDLKWGERSYRDLLEGGRAVQLSAYVRAVRTTSGRRSMPPAAYYSLGSAKVLTADARIGAPETLEGLSLEETWARIERTVDAVQASLREGRVYVAATKRALPVLDAIGVSPSDRDKHHARANPTDACAYCAYPAICGRAWEDDASA